MLATLPTTKNRINFSQSLWPESYCPLGEFYIGSFIEMSDMVLRRLAFSKGRNVTQFLEKNKYGVMPS
jgi:hypothetical protein